MFLWTFFNHSLKESVITSSFVEWQPCLAYRDYETILLTFRIMNLKIDAYSIFIKKLPWKKLSVPYFVDPFFYSAVE